jgi:hypothetical protein
MINWKIGMQGKLGMREGPQTEGHDFAAEAGINVRQVSAISEPASNVKNVTGSGHNECRDWSNRWAGINVSNVSWTEDPIRVFATLRRPDYPVAIPQFNALLICLTGAADGRRARRTEAFDDRYPYPIRSILARRADVAHGIGAGDCWLA